MIGPAAGLVALLLLVALILSPSSLLVRVSAGSPVDPAVTGRATTAPAVPPGRVVTPSGEPALREPDSGALAAAALADLLQRRDEAVRSGRAEGWSLGAEDSFEVVTALPVTGFASSVVPDSVVALDGDEPGGATGRTGADRDGADGARADGVDAAEGEWQARVETSYELAGGPAVVRTDTVRLDPPGPGEADWELVSWAPFPQQGEIGTAAPWDLGPVRAVVGERAVVLSWHDEAALDPSGAPSTDRDAGWGPQVLSWADTGAVAVDSYLGNGWPRLSLVLVPATPEQYDALVPGPAPESDDVFAAVTADVETPDGGGDVVVLNPSVRDQLADETWQVTVTHELVHVASGAIHGDEQEIWLAEGLADLVGWSSVVPGRVDRDVVAARLLERVADGSADLADLPDLDDFGSDDSDVVGDAYEGSWLAALLLQDEVGTDALLDAYAAASTGEGSTRERTDAALLEATGEGREAFRARWAEYLRGLAAEPR